MKIATFLVSDEVANGALEPLTTPTEATPADVYAVMDAVSAPTRVKRLVDHLITTLRAAGH